MIDEAVAFGTGVGVSVIATFVGRVLQRRHEQCALARKQPGIYGRPTAAFMHLTRQYSSEEAICEPCPQGACHRIFG